MKNKMTVSIGIPAFNEEDTLKRLLPSLLAQKYKHVFLKKILVYSDASSDKTNQAVKLFGKQHSVVRLIVGKKRKGKYYRMNELFKRCQTDILIIMDADIAMVGDNFIDTLGSVLLSDKNALMVAARNRFVTPKGFMSRVLHAYFMMWDNILPGLPHIDSAGQFSGTATAFRGIFAYTLRIPPKVINPHLFLYLAARSKNGFRFYKKAEVLQIVPSTMSEVKTVLERATVKSDPALDAIFGSEMIRNAYTVPLMQKIKVVVISFFQNPFYTPGALGMTVYLRYVSSKLKVKPVKLWKVIHSTKKPISYV